MNIPRSRSAPASEIKTRADGYRRLCANILLQWSKDFASASRTCFCFYGWTEGDYFEMLCNGAEVDVYKARETMKKILFDRHPVGKGFTGSKSCWMHCDGLRIPVTLDVVSGYVIRITDENGHKYQPVLKRHRDDEDATPNLTLGRFMNAINRITLWEV